jgi:hypothetical protein
LPDTETGLRTSALARGSLMVIRASGAGVAERFGVGVGVA